MKKLFSAVVLAAMVLALLSGCNAGGGNSKKVGISMPTNSLQRWNEDGKYLKEKFEAAGYTVDLQYGNDDSPTQVGQVENMISNGCSVLVIAAIEGGAFTEVLKTAKEKNITVIAHDRLIMNTDAVSYYATFDNQKVGNIQGEYIRDNLKLDSTDGPYNIELFTGDPGDNNIHYFFGGAMDILQPYIDSGKLVVKSGQVSEAQAATPGWKTENAQTRMEDLIAAQGYGPNGTKLDAVYCSNDSTAQGVTNALINAGYTAANFPIVTGQDCDKASVKNMIAGTQSMSVFKDTRTLAEQVVEMVSASIEGKTVPTNNTTDYDNGVKKVPTFLCEPVYGDANNYYKLLIEGGYYTEDDLK